MSEAFVLATSSEVAVRRSAGFTCRLAELEKFSDDGIVGSLVTASVRRLDQAQENRQIRAWQDELPILRAAAAELLAAFPSAAQWSLVLEFEIPRRGTRIDAVLLTHDLILAVEFKVGQARRLAQDARQVEDYALELRDFHEGSHERVIVPLLCATEFRGRDVHSDIVEWVPPVSTCGAKELGATVRELHQRLSKTNGRLLDAEEWFASRYRPTPTIIEAAQALYAKHNVREIARSESAAVNLAATQEAIQRAVRYAQEHRRKVACFVTGVPGAGKTLAGLTFVNGFSSGKAVFLSGNSPLVKVLREALAVDAAERKGSDLKAERHTAGTFVDNVHRWLDEYIDNKPNAVPLENVVCFDEAQRAWNQAQSKRKFNRDASEPSMMLRALSRRDDWAVLIALIGNGQEINTGEAGIAEWGQALAGEFQEWDVYLSSRLASGAVQSEFERLPPAVTARARVDDALHLEVPTRSFRADRLVNWVGAVLQGNAAEARSLAKSLKAYPLVITRDLERAREWLSQRCRGLRRSGLVATSGGRRLRPHGIEVTLDLQVEEWFLAPSDDVRASSFLELPATEFAVQGLELDWVGLCWDADLRWSQDKQRWESFAFRGTDWVRVHAAEKQQYILNKYRVLLTRGREGLVIWVPPGSSRDGTRNPEWYDANYRFLLSCGAQEL